MSGRHYTSYVDIRIHIYNAAKTFAGSGKCGDRFHSWVVSLTMGHSTGYSTELTVFSIEQTRNFEFIRLQGPCKTPRLLKFTLLVHR